MDHNFFFVIYFLNQLRNFFLRFFPILLLFLLKCYSVIECLYFGGTLKKLSS